MFLYSLICYASINVLAWYTIPPYTYMYMYISPSQSQVDPSRGTVGFGSGLHGWAFTLKQFAEIYSEKFKIDPPKLMKRLWGDQFYNAKERKWNKSGGDGYVRGFCQFVLDPIYKVSVQLEHTSCYCVCTPLFHFLSCFISCADPLFS